VTRAEESLSLLFTIWIAVLGLVIGSFLNVVIWRLPRGESIVRPRSRCPSCGHSLSWFENIPLVSWLVLRGKCRACRAEISWRYPAIELLTAVLFLACIARFDWTLQAASALMLVVLLVPLTFIDLEHWLLPFALTLPGIGLGLAFAAAQGLAQFRASAIGAAVGFGGFWAMEFIGAKVFRKEALGGGDKYLLALIGAFLTYRALLAVVFLSSLQGAVVGVALLLLKGRAGPAPAETPSGPDAPTQGEDEWVPGPTNIPFGPWLSLAAIEVLLVGPLFARLLPTNLSWMVS
jgi:leader peptidase (prepilin peptidase) / N-methyltransferase